MIDASLIKARATATRRKVQSMLADPRAGPPTRVGGGHYVNRVLAPSRTHLGTTSTTRVDEQVERDGGV